MRILVTRPQKAAQRTAERLEALGHTVLIDSLLILEFAPPEHLAGDEHPDAIVITSANGARAVEDHPGVPHLARLPLWTVGSRTTEAARALGFGTPKGEALDIAELAEMLNREAPQTLLHLAGEARSGDLGELTEHRVITRVVYSATPVRAFRPETAEVLGGRHVDAVLHYSRRLAETYLALARDGGFEDFALAPAQLCLSEHVAAPLRAANARDVRAAATPREDALIALLG